MADEDGLRTATAPEGDAPVQPGNAIGRFLVLGTLGVGGMGVVLSAYDPALDRKVAIKLLRGDPVFAAATRGRAQLVAEAQALARLSHPNVVAVHEIAFSDGAAFLVMEHIAGPTLRRWLAERSPSLHEVLAMFRSAGGGLAAAHREGIVHRDFKPENVLVDGDGRARVVDFGIAATVSAHALAGDAGRGGTLAYMAPEQLRGEPCDPRADQFAYCVALWEALHGSRPFEGATAEALEAAIAAGHVCVPARRTPDWVRAALLRGLQAAPDARWPSLDDLLEVLGREPRPVRRWIAGTAASIALVAAVLGALWPASTSVDPCAGAATRFAGVWDVPRKIAVQAAFAATRAAYAGDTWGRVSARLDAYVAGWGDMAGEACRATRVEGRQSDTLLDLRMACLEQRRATLGALTALWARGVDPDTLENAVDAVRALPPLTECADERALRERTPPPADPIHARMVAATRPKLDAVLALTLAHRWAEARPAAAAVRPQADATGWPLLRAEAAFAEGDVLAKLKDPGAEAPLLDAVRLAGAARDDRLAARALTSLVAHVAADQQQAQRAMQLAAIAEGAVDRAGNDDELRGRLLTARGAALVTSGKLGAASAAYVDARAHFTRVFGAHGLETLSTVADLAAVAHVAGDERTALELGREVLAATIDAVGPDHPRLAGILNNLALSSAAAGDYPAAATYYQRALDINRRVVGPEAASTALTMSNLAPLELALGHLDTAQRLLERALRIQERALGPEHGHVATTLGNLANVRRMQGRHAEAVQLLQRALAIKTKVYGAEHASLAYLLHAMARVFYAQGDHVRELAWDRRALEIRRRALGEDHPRTLATMAYVSAALAELGRCAEARPLLALASAGLEKRVGTQHPDYALVLGATGMCELASGAARQAIAHLERAIAINETVKESSGSYRWWLVRSLWAAGRRDDARRTARVAAHELDSDADGRVERSAVDAWLAAHRH